MNYSPSKILSDTEVLQMPRKGENIYKRKDNRWEGRYRTGYDKSGKAKYSSVYGKSYQEVKIKLTALKSDSFKKVSSGVLTVKELFEEFFSLHL